MTVARRAQAPATLYFDLASPYTYLVAERADRLFARLRWQPAVIDPLGDECWGPIAMIAARERAALLGLPLIWPDERPPRVREAMRVAALAAERGRGAPFVLAASRLAFCGGYDLDAPEILAEAAAAAGIGLRETLAAAGEIDRDVAIAQAGRSLRVAGATRLPTLEVGGMLFCGEDRLLAARAALVTVADGDRGRLVGN